MNGVVHRLVLFSYVIVDIMFPHYSLVFSQSSYCVKCTVRTLSKGIPTMFAKLSCDCQTLKHAPFFSRVYLLKRVLHYFFVQRISKNGKEPDCFYV